MRAHTSCCGAPRTAGRCRTSCVDGSRRTRSRAWSRSSPSSPRRPRARSTGRRSAHEDRDRHRRHEGHRQGGRRALPGRRRQRRRRGPRHLRRHRRGAGQRPVRRRRAGRRARQQRRARGGGAGREDDARRLAAPSRGQRHRRLPLHARRPRRHDRARGWADRDRRVDRGPEGRPLHGGVHGRQARRRRPDARRRGGDGRHGRDVERRLPRLGADEHDAPRRRADRRDDRPRRAAGRGGARRPDAARPRARARGSRVRGRVPRLAGGRGDQRADDRARRGRDPAVSPYRGSAAFTDEWKHFDLALDDGVATVTFSRPDKLNALTFDVYADLRDLLAELPHRGDARVLVLTGEGRGFCSGGDVDEIIGELQKLPAGELLAFTRMSGTVVKSMRDSPLPIVAAVNGVAAGAGAVLALAADFRLLASSAKFAFLFTRVGLAGADMGAAYLLPRLVGLGRATELLVLGDEVSAERAVDLGLASRIAEDLPAAAEELARKLADGPALAYSTTKLLLTRELDLDLGGAIEMEALAQALLMKSDDFGEFYAAWSEGRSPAWSGR